MRHAARQSGIWIDHSHAIVIDLGPDDSCRTRTFQSDVERSAKSQGGSHGRVGTHHVLGAHHLRLAERRRHALRNFYRRIWNALEDVDDVIVFGPGLAPKELVKEAAAQGVAPERVRGVLPLGEPTEGELRARVREFFGRGAPRGRAVA